MKYKSKKELDLYRDEILLFLPYFINQLLLLLSSGMVLQEAMKIIAINYEVTGYDDKNAFVKAFKEIYEESKNTGRSMVSVFNDFSKNSRIKELSRLGGILLDCDKRGVNIWEKLSEERRHLWQEKKRMILEQIRLSESKMSFPLALLLIALILIAAAPAMMQMYI